ncbi:alpha/beta hydrolase [Sphingomonas sp. ID1715]|uniref:alpha/beta hydrolase family protein n=1 Tax=Sphingomonas sp. ID1715 TaxID=1656898 RepID=UPI001488BB80|nr:alpha/beta hydrolase [Sphingomonas sp. ID1715]NNM77433.1 alpha/beta hydrolase [Sphingomonas sp. ID1715]
MRFLILAMLIASGAGAQTLVVGDLPRKQAQPLEATPGLETEYGAVQVSDGYRLRTILTRPAGAKGKLPAIFMTQAVSCGSLELPPESQSVMRQLPLRSGYAFIRVERAGTGDSEGPACSALDYDTEVRHYREAFDQLSRHPWIDPTRIVIYGSSLGATTAPLVAQGKRVAGVVVQGGGALTYLERMINFDRFYFERSGKFAAEEVHDRVLKSVRFNQAYLLGRKLPEQVEREQPDLKGVWVSMRGTVEDPPHYGRPHQWHWQVAEKNFLAAWTRIDAPILVLWGEHEQFEPRHGHRMIVDAVNALRPGTATFVEMPGIDHGLSRHASAYAAYRDEGGQISRDALLVPMLAWLETLSRR